MPAQFRRRNSGIEEGAEEAPVALMPWSNALTLDVLPSDFSLPPSLPPLPSSEVLRKKKYEVKIEDPLDQFVYNMASSLLTSLELLGRHSRRRGMEDVRIPAVLNERRNLNKLARTRGAKKETPAKAKARPQVAYERQDSALPTITELVREGSEAKPAIRSDKKQRRKRASVDFYEVEAPDIITRNYMTPTVDFELKHIEMVRKLAQEFKTEEGEMKQQFVNIAPEEAGEDIGEEDTEQRHQAMRREQYELTWAADVMESSPLNDVETQLADIMKGKQLKDLPFSTPITFNTFREEPIEKVVDLGKIDPSLNPNSEGREAEELRQLFKRYCLGQLSHSDVEAGLQGVLLSRKATLRIQARSSKELETRSTSGDAGKRC